MLLDLAPSNARRTLLAVLDHRLCIFFSPLRQKEPHIMVIRFSLTVIVTMLREHAKADKVVYRGAKVISTITAGSRDCAEVLVAQGGRAVLEAIAANSDHSAKAHTAVRKALSDLV